MCIRVLKSVKNICVFAYLLRYTISTGNPIPSFSFFIFKIFVFFDCIYVYRLVFFFARIVFVIIYHSRYY